MRVALLITSMVLAGTSLPAQVNETARVRGLAPDKAPAALRPAIGRAEQAMNALQSALLARLSEQMKAGGPASAVAVCRDEAQTIGARVAQEQGVALGRTSHRLRSPKNAPPAWAQPLVLEAAGTKAAAHGVRAYDLGDRVGVVRPIGFVETCGACHGAPDRIPDAVRAIVASAYPADAATGFAPGDLRGWMWAEVPKQ